jgi:HlyD family secretion protein
MLGEPNPSFLHQAESDDFLPPVRLWTQLCGILLVSTVGGLFLLAAFLKYNVVIKATAAVRPIGEVRVVEASAEGSVRQIYVKENQLVKQGEPIAAIDNSRLQTQVNQLQDSISKVERQLIQSDAQIGALERQIEAEKNRLSRTVAAAQAQLQLSQRNYQNQQITTLAEVQQAEASLELAREELTRYQQLADTGAIAQLQVKQKQAAFKAATAQLESARAALNPSRAPEAIASEEIAQRHSEGEAAIANLTKEREALVQQRVQLENQIGIDRQQVAQLQKDLQETIVRAPVDGIILHLNLRNPNQVVQAQDAIAQITPSNAPLVIKAQVPSQDINKIKIGQVVQMRVSACPYPEFGTLQGTVSSISPDIVNQVQTQNAGASGATYEIAIAPKTLKLAQGGRECNIQAGMEGRADVIAKEETVLQFLLRKARLIADV